MRKYIKEIINLLIKKGIFRWIPDSVYIRLRYRIKMGKKLELQNPKTLNEKLQWLKLYDKDSRYIKMVDKYEVKQYVADLIGAEYIIPTIGIWDSFEDINFSVLPDKFVLKCTHDSGSAIICRDKKDFDKKVAKKKINRALKSNYYWTGREWAYKSIKPRIIAEQYMEEKDSNNLKDYKIFCFDGEPKIILTVEGGHEDESKVNRRMYNTKWEKYAVGLRGKEIVKTSESKPLLLDKMLELATKLSANIKHIRVDFYVIDNQVYFGELTFFHMSGMEEFKPEDYDELFGGFLNLNL